MLWDLENARQIELGNAVWAYNLGLCGGAIVEL